MKSMIAVFAFVMMAQAQAQAQSQAQVQNQGQNQVQNQAQAQAPVQSVPGEAVQSAPVQNVQPQPSSSPIYILNNQRFNGSVANDANSSAAAGSKAAQVQEQPTTVVQEVKSGAAESARKYREATESATEDTIVQTLEKARMTDEVRRRDRFNNAINADGSPVVTQTTTQTVVQPVQAPIQVTPLPAASPTPSITQEVNVYVPSQHPAPAPTPVATPIVEEVPVQVIAPRPVVIVPEARPVAEPVEIQKEEPKPYYAAGLLGLSKYPDVINVRSNVAAGVAVGMALAERFSLEASFLYSSYQLDDILLDYASGYGIGRTVDMTQYNLSLAGKYNILTGRLRPFVGVVGSYVRRNYYENYGTGQSGDAFRNSNAVDAGGIVGVDYSLTPSFSIGFDFRYLTNVFYRQTTCYPSSLPYASMNNEIEKLDYYQALLSAKFNF